MRTKSFIHVTIHQSPFPLIISEIVKTLNQSYFHQSLTWIKHCWSSVINWLLNYLFFSVFYRNIQWYLILILCYFSSIVFFPVFDLTSSFMFFYYHTSTNIQLVFNINSLLDAHCGHHLSPPQPLWFKLEKAFSSIFKVYLKQ